MPSIEWLDARIDLVMKPVVLDRSLTFSIEDVVVGGRLDVAKTCSMRLVGPQLCKLIERQAVGARARVAAEIKAALQDISLKRQVAAAARQYLDDTASVPILGVRHVTMADGNLVIALALGR